MWHVSVVISVKCSNFEVPVVKKSCDLATGHEMCDLSLWMHIVVVYRRVCVCVYAKLSNSNK